MAAHRRWAGPIVSEPQLQSMTGFASDEASLSIGETVYRWVWELRSLNGRGLDLRLRLPQAFSTMEANIRKLVSRQFTRGSVSINLTLKNEKQDQALQVDEVALGQAINLINRVRLETECALPSAEHILMLPGVMVSGQDEMEAAQQALLEEAIFASLESALQKLQSARRKEGDALRQVLVGLVDDIAKKSEAAKAIETETLQEIKQRVRRQIEDIQSDVTIDDDRLAQEVALLATKADIREELDRLQAHIEAARQLLGQSGPVGRKLDFLTQEFNREANTLCSKTPAIRMKEIGLSLKLLIDQMREQVQNVE